MTVVHGGKLLLNPAYPDKVRKSAAKSLEARGIEVIVDDFIDEPETKAIQGITTRSGKELKDADLVVRIRPSFLFRLYTK